MKNRKCAVTLNMLRLYMVDCGVNNSCYYILDCTLMHCTALRSLTLIQEIIHVLMENVEPGLCLPRILSRRTAVEVDAWQPDQWQNF